MVFKQGRKFGKYWEDVKQLDKYIRDHDFNSNSQTEKEFENGFASALKALTDSFNTELVTQVPSFSSSPLRFASPSFRLSVIPSHLLQNSVLHSTKNKY